MFRLAIAFRALSVSVQAHMHATCTDIESALNRIMDVQQEVMKPCYDACVKGTNSSIGDGVAEAKYATLECLKQDPSIGNSTMLNRIKFLRVLAS